MKIEKTKKGVFINGKLTGFKKIPTVEQIVDYLAGKEPVKPKPKVKKSAK